MEFDKIFGLPAHPLLVHGAVVLVPLAAVALIGVGWRDVWRRAYYLPVALLATAGAAASFLAKESGEPLAESVRHAGKRVGEHPEQGDTAFIAALVLAGACIALCFWQTFGERLRQRIGLNDRFRAPFNENALLWALSVPVAAVAIWTMVAAGHSGATLVWKTNR